MLGHVHIGLGWKSPAEVAVGAQDVPAGVVHEWFAEGEPALCLLAHHAAAAAAPGRREAGLIVWIGRRCWPFPRHRAGLAGARSLLVDAASPAERLWSADLCVRSRAVAAVVADGAGFDLAATRRLQLAAKAGGALLMLARPMRELRGLSAAAVRWRVAPVPSPTSHPRWTVELLRCKGLLQDPDHPRTWVMEWRHEAGVVVVPADVVDQPLGEEAEGEGGEWKRWKIA